MRGVRNIVKAHHLKQFAISVIVGLAVATLSALGGWALYRLEPEGMVLIANPCTIRSHSFGIGYALGLFVGGILGLLFSLVYFLATLLPRWRAAAVSVRRKAVTALLIAPLLLLFWPAHGLIEQQLPMRPMPGCPLHAL